MLSISLILTGIALALNGVVSLCHWDRRGLATTNILIGIYLVGTSIYSIYADVDTVTVFVNFGMLLFGFTLLFMASDIIWASDKRTFGWFCIMLAVCAITLAVYFLLSDIVFWGILWALWSLIWIFLFAGFGVNAKFRRSSFYCLIFQGVVTLMAIGFLELFDIINIAG